ncbi:MAG: PilN domain-containing protein [Gammaproteobacteria bacterium]|nr:PilN domain-containing protein [Gammaproteobacteria bacterium]
MLQQEVNLFRFFKTASAKHTLLDWRSLWLLNGIFLFFCILLYGYYIWQNHRLENKKSEQLVIVSNFEKQFYEAKAKFPEFFFTQDVSQSIEKLQLELVSQEKLLISITNQKIFSQILFAFSRTIVPNVWLTRMVISKGGNEIALKGNGFSMTEVQVFLNNLVKEKLFTDYILNIKNIENTVKDKTINNLSFEVTLSRKL